MKKKLLIGLTIALCVITVSVGYSVYWMFFDMNRLPKGEYVTEQVSPDGTYTLKAYVVNGNATVSNAIRGELVFNNTNEKAKTVYWNYRESTATITWLDQDTVEINGHILDIPNEKYDFRHE